MPLAAAVPGLPDPAGPAVWEAGNWDTGAPHAEEDASHPHGPGPCVQFQLEIVGTGIEFDPYTGLPSHLEGDVFYAGGRLDGQFAGVYHEDVTPILHPEYGFLGASGVGVYTFQTGRDGATLGELTVQYESLIVGLDATGAMLVQTEGDIVGGARLMRGVEGAFTSSSSVLVGAEFAMHVEVNVHAGRPIPFSGIAARLERSFPDRSPTAPSFARGDGAPHLEDGNRGSGRSGWSHGRDDAVDRVFAGSSPADWFEDDLLNGDWRIDV